MRVGIVGCGAIGTDLAKFAAAQVEISSLLLFDQSPERAQQLSKVVPKSKVAQSGDALVTAVELLIECASQDAARLYLPLAVNASRSVMCLSMGVFADDKFRTHLVETARKNGVKIYLPSGAIAA